MGKETLYQKLKKIEVQLPNWKETIVLIVTLTSFFAYDW
jgi:hypothetical protein